MSELEELMSVSDSDVWEVGRYRIVRETREELLRQISDFLTDQIRQYPDAAVALRQLAVRVRHYDL